MHTRFNKKIISRVFQRYPTCLHWMSETRDTTFLLK